MSQRSTGSVTTIMREEEGRREEGDRGERASSKNRHHF
jgi:hypothetical protein